MPQKCLTPHAALRPMRAGRRRSPAWRAETLERRTLLDAAGTLAAVPVTWGANDTSLMTGNIDQPGEVDLYRFTTAEPARLSLQARPRGGDPLEGQVKLLAVGDVPTDAHLVAADELSVAHPAAVDGWIVPGEYLIAVAADDPSSQGAVDMALGDYDLALKLDRPETSSSWKYSDTTGDTITYETRGVQNLTTTVAYQPTAVSDSFFGASAPALSVLLGGPNGSFSLNRSADATSSTNTSQSGTSRGTTIVPTTSANPSPQPISRPQTSSNSPSGPAANVIAPAHARTPANFPAAAAPVGRNSGAGAAASLPGFGRPAASAPVSSQTPTRASGPAALADGSDSSQEGELEYSYRRASAVLSQAIGGTLRQVRDAAVIALGEAVRFDILGDDKSSGWFDDALDVILPALPGGAALDAALEGLGIGPVLPVRRPKARDDRATATEAAPAEYVSAASAGLAALALARPVGAPGAPGRLPQKSFVGRRRGLQLSC